MGIKIVTNGAISFFVKRMAGPFLFRRRWLNRTQWFSREKLEALQLTQLQKLIHHCYTTVPYYRQLMDDRGFSVASIKSLADIEKFPILTKDDVLQAGDAIVSTKYQGWRLRKAQTGGSTGRPLSLYRNLFSIGNEHAFVRRQWDWAGVGLFDKSAYLTGRIVPASKSSRSQHYSFDPVLRELTLSTYHLSAEVAVEYIGLIKAYGVKTIVGFPSTVYILAQACLDQGVTLELNSILMTSETLTDSMRKTIGQAFQCGLFDFYGSAERVCYIHTCENGSYHIIPEYGVTELLPIEGSSDNQCQIVATGFWNRAMPLVRYDQGDIVVACDDVCECGRYFPRVKSIIGRIGDFIQSPSGEKYGAPILTHLLFVVSGVTCVLETQFIQDALNHVTVEYVPGMGFSSEQFLLAQQRFVEQLPKDLKIDFKLVRAVQRTKQGKVRSVVSLI